MNKELIRDLVITGGIYDCICETEYFRYTVSFMKHFQLYFHKSGTSDLFVLQ
jgi:hypothetical protein